MNIQLENACNGKYASGKGLNTQDLRSALIKAYPEHSKQISDPTLRRKGLEDLCKRLMKEKIEKRKDTSPKINRVKQVKQVKQIKQIKQVPKKVLLFKKQKKCIYPKYLRHVDECHRVPPEELHKLAQNCSVPVDPKTTDVEELCMKIWDYTTKLSNLLHKFGLSDDKIKYDELSSNQIDTVRKYLLNYLNEYSQKKGINAGFPTRIVLCHSREHSLQFPKDYLLVDVNPLYYPDVVADSALIALGFPNNWVELLILKGCPIDVYSDPFFWDQWLSKLKIGGEILIHNVYSNKIVPLILNPNLQDYFKGIGLLKPTIGEYLAHLITLSGHDINNYQLKDVYISDDPVNYDPNYRTYRIDPYTKRALLITKIGKSDL